MNNNVIEIDINDGDHQRTSKKPPKLVYCGDGVLEEYSDDDELEEKKKQVEENDEKESQIDTVGIFIIGG
jgi:hypothetical protein